MQKGEEMPVNVFLNIISPPDCQLKRVVEY
jgi:hypothetical protein